MKKLSTLLLLCLMAAPMLAQTICSKHCDGVLFAPQKGQWQFTLLLGNGGNFYNEGLTAKLMPFSDGDYNNVGISNSDITSLLNINGYNNNSITKVVGLEAKYFVSNCWALNFQFAMNINVTPKKDFVEGDFSVAELPIPNQTAIDAQMTNYWYTSVGADRYFKVNNPRIHPFVGVQAGFQMARVEASRAYYGDTADDPDGDLNGELPEYTYYANSNAGQVFGIKAAGVAGVEYSLAPGLIVGLQVQPLAYRYDVIQLCPKGFDKYNATHHNIKLLDMAQVKVGFRF